MNLHLSSKKIALVTGGTSGLGLATARKFISQNIFTIITGRDKLKLDETAASLGELCYPLSMDMTQLEAIPAHVQQLADRFGRIDVLVNNAGINLKKDFTEVTDQDFFRIIQTNLLGVFSLSREVVKIMIAQGSGSIINVSSMAAQYGIPKVIAYTASKTAVEGMTRAMAVELSPLGIRVNCIAPGFIETKMSAAALNSDPDRKKKVLSRTPMGKLGLPEDVANLAYFLAEDDARYVTGTIIPVDGGNSIGF